jgi:hypothetical protein
VTPRKREQGRRPPTGATAQFDAYLSRRPESDPRILLPRSAPLVARGAFLLHGVLVLDWSVAWLTAFFFAEFFLIVRLSVLGDRFSTGRKLDRRLHRTTSLGFQLFWLAVTLAALVYTGQALERSTRGEGFGVGAGGLLAWPGWGMLLYLGFLLGEFAFDLRAARRAKRAFASAGLLQASFFFFAVLVLSFFGIVLAGIFGQIFGDAGPRGVLAVLLVLARTGSELAVLWIPLWGPGQLARVAARSRARK